MNKKIWKLQKWVLCLCLLLSYDIMANNLSSDEAQPDPDNSEEVNDIDDDLSSVSLYLGVGNEYAKKELDAVKKSLKNESIVYTLNPRWNYEIGHRRNQTTFSTRGMSLGAIYQYSKGKNHDRLEGTKTSSFSAMGVEGLVRYAYHYLTGYIFAEGGLNFRKTSLSVSSAITENLNSTDVNFTLNPGVGFDFEDNLRVDCLYNINLKSFFVGSSYNF